MTSSSEGRFPAAKIRAIGPACAAMLAIAASLAGCKSKSQEEGEIPPVAVELATVKRMDLPIMRQAVGTLRANQIAQIAPEVAGKILRMEFQDGQRVNENDPLVYLDNQQQQADLEKATAQFKQAEWNYNKTLSLYNQKVAGPLELTQSQTDRDSAKAAMTQSKAILDKMTICAPFSGKLSVRLVDKGNYVSPGQTIVVLQQDDPMLVDFNIPESYASELALGQPVFVTIPEYEGNISTQPSPESIAPPTPANASQPASTPTPASTRAIEFFERTVEGKVIAMAPFIDQSTRSISIRGRFENPDHKLISGQFVKVDLRVGWQQHAIVIPQEAIVIGEKSAEVFVVENNVAKRMPIKVYDFNKDNAVITGLSAGQIIVRIGWQKLRDGSTVFEVPSAGQGK